jgi:hypothetical protein
MSFASGFFNSVDHDRLYDATDISRLFDGLIRDGIFASIGDCLVVKQSNQMNVTVGTGRAWFNHTWSYNDALYPVTIPPSEILMDRIDAVVLEINSVESVRANSIKLIKGTPSSTPAKPALTNTKEVHQYPLAYVTVGKEVTSIRQADIENCVGTSACPFVTGILEVISIEQLIPQWKDILNRFVEENTANFNTWMNGEKQEYQDWLTAAKKEITDWQATSKSDYQKWYDSIKNGYDQWFATIKAAYDANWSTFQQWEKASQTEFDKWFENIKNKLEGDLGVKLTLEAEKLGKEKVSLIESTKTDLEGTVEAPLMLGNATRNLLKPPLAAHSGYGIKMTKINDGTLKLNGTARENYVFYLQGNSSQSVPFENTVGGCKMLGCPINGSQDTYRIDVCYYNSSELNSELKAVASDIGNGVIINDAYPYLNYRLYINKGTTVTNLIFKPMVTSYLEATIDDFVPYSGYDIKTIGKNIVGNPSSRNSPTVKDGIITFPAKSAADDDTYLRLYDDVDISAFDTFRVVVESINETINGPNKSYVLIKTGGKKEFSTLSHTSFESSANKYVSEVFNCLDFGNEIAEITIVIKKGYAYPGGSYKISVFNGEDKEFSDWVKYVESSVHIDSSTEFPNFDLKSFDGATHIISPGNVQSFHADAPNGKYLLESIKKSAESGGVSYGATEPTNPKPGDLWVDTNHSSVLKYYNGGNWETSNSGIYITGGGFPSSPYNGQLCYSPFSKMMNVYIASSGPFGAPGWYPVGSDDPGGYHYGASAPTNTKLLWIDTSGVARFYNGSAWVPLAATWG